MLPLKSIFLKLGLCLAIYFGLLLLFSAPPLEKAYGNLFTGINKTLTSWTIPNGFIQYQMPKGKPDGKATIVIGNKQHIEAEKQRIKSTGRASQVNVQMGNFPVNYKQTSLYPLIFLWSLILVTPGTWKQKLIGGAIGTVVLFLFVGFRIYINLLVNYHNTPWLEVVELSGMKLDLVTKLYNILNFGITLIVVMIIWLFSVLRKDNVEKMKGFLAG